MKNIYEERAEKAEAARDDARRKYKQAKELAQKFDDVIDDLKCAVSCINPLEDLKRAILALKERAEKAEAQLAERDAETARLHELLQQIVRHHDEAMRAAVGDEANYHQMRRNQVLFHLTPNAQDKAAVVGSPRLSAEPVAWIRYCSDGSYEGPIVGSMMEALRKESGAWTPLFAKREDVAQSTKDKAKARAEFMKMLAESAAGKAWATVELRDAEIARLRADARFREETTSNCWCATCTPITMYDMRMVLCPECGNKRCPRATNHIYQCTARKDAK